MIKIIFKYKKEEKIIKKIYLEKPSIEKKILAFINELSMYDSSIKGTGELNKWLK